MIEQKEKNFISAVVYFWNNETTARQSVEQLAAVLNSHFENFEIICVDDGSADDTVQQIGQADTATMGCIISVVKMSGHQGLEAAISAGVNHSIGDYVFEFEKSQFDFPDALIMQVYQKALSGYDIVSASNKSYKRTSSGLFYNVLNKNARLHYQVKSETFRIVSRRGINRVYSMGKFVKYRKALYANCGLKSANIEYVGTKNAAKELDGAYRMETAINSIILFTDFAYKVSIAFSMLMMAATVFTAVYTLVVFISRHAVEGFTTTMLVLSGSFFAVFLLFAIVIKYLSVLVQLVFHEQEYMIESVEKIAK